MVVLLHSDTMTAGTVLSYGLGVLSKQYERTFQERSFSLEQPQ